MIRAHPCSPFFKLEHLLSHVAGLPTNGPEAAQLIGYDRKEAIPFAKHLEQRPRFNGNAGPSKA